MPDTSASPGPTDAADASLLYNEYICYDVAQVQLRYLFHVSISTFAPSQRGPGSQHRSCTAAVSSSLPPTSHACNAAALEELGPRPLLARRRPGGGGDGVEARREVQRAAESQAVEGALVGIAQLAARRARGARPLPVGDAAVFRERESGV
ncbi:hypothetical protein CDD83_6424 [Cordyceps sp. RAO-2017]|nr:hypothetical protein CDD83_6424 [Cordyceps sp. RAO-2017]